MTVNNKRVRTIAAIPVTMTLIFALLLLFLPPSFIHPVAAAIGAVLQIHKAGSEQRLKYLTVRVMFFILTFAYLAILHKKLSWCLERYHDTSSSHTYIRHS